MITTDITQEQKDLVRLKLKERLPIAATEMAALNIVAKEDSPPAIVEDFIIRNAKVVIYGKAKRHKTNFTMATTIRISAGKDVFNKQGHFCKTLYVSCEQKEEHLGERANKMLDRYNPKPDWSLYYLRPDERNQARIRCLVDKHKPELLILDPIQQLIIPEDDHKAWNSWLSFFDKLIQDFDITLILVHHRRKSAPMLHTETLDNIIDDLRGLSQFSGWLNVIIGIVRQKPRVKDDIEVGFEPRDSKEDMDYLGFHFDRETCAFESIPTRDNARTEKHESVATWLEENYLNYDKVTDAIIAAQELFGYKTQKSIWNIWSTLGLKIPKKDTK